MKNYLFITAALFLMVACTTEAKDENVEETKKDPFEGRAIEDIKPEETEVWDPEPRVVTPGNSIWEAPSDAIVLFDGINADAWMHTDASPLKWEVEDGILRVKPGTGNIQTKQPFGDIQLHLEFKAPDPSERQGPGQGQGNSGVFLQGRYEIQVLDSYNNRTYANGQAGSIYKQSPPLVNAMKPPSQWNTYDIIFRAPKFDEAGKRTKAGTLTVLHNGVLVQDHFELEGTTEYIGPPKNEAHGEEVLILQDHGDAVSYRNIWVRKL